MPDGKPMLEMNALAGNSGVKVVLRIPIKGTRNIGYIEYTRLYYNNRGADVQNNEGGMTEFKFTGFIMPLVKFNNEDDAIFNVSCIQSVTNRIDFQFFKGDERLQFKNRTCRNEDQQIMNKADNYLLKEPILTLFVFIIIMDMLAFSYLFLDNKEILSGLNLPLI